MKGVAVMLVFFFLRREFDGVLDGIAYAGVVALGFATVENVLYYGRAVAKEGFGALLVVFVLRGVLGPFTHAVYTAMTGIGFGIARETHKPALRALAPLVGFGLAAFLHFLWNTLAGAGGRRVLPHLSRVLGAPLPGVLRRGRLDGPPRVAPDPAHARRGGRRGADHARPGRSRWRRGPGGSAGSSRPSANPRASGLGGDSWRPTTRLALCNWHVARAQAAGGVTVSFAQIPSLFSEIHAVRGQV